MKVMGTKPTVLTYHFKLCFHVYIIDSFYTPIRAVSVCQVTVVRMTLCVSAKEGGTESSSVGEAGHGGKDV